MTAVNKVNRLFPRAEDLNAEEVDYELQIRNQPEEVVSQNLAEKQRLLRNLFRSDSNEGRNYPSNHMIGDEASLIEGRITNLEKALMKSVEPKLESSVLHYWYRAKRCIASNDEDKKLRRYLIRRIEKVMQDFQFGPPLSPYKEHINSIIEEVEAGQGAVGNTNSQSSEQQISAEKEKLSPGSGQVVDHPDTSKGAVKKITVTVPTGPTIVISKREYEKMENTLRQLSARLYDQNLATESNSSRENEALGYPLSQRTSRDARTALFGKEGQERETTANR